MTSTNGTCNGHRAVKYSDNSIYILIAIRKVTEEPVWKPGGPYSAGATGIASLAKTTTSLPTVNPRGLRPPPYRRKK
jgi:hypothetical protein